MHTHRWCEFVRQDLTAFRICHDCQEREDCPLPVGYVAVPMAEAPAYILPIETGVQLTLW